MAFLNEDGLKKLVQGLWSDIQTLFSSIDTTVSWSEIEDKPDVALKSDISEVYRFKGSVSTVEDLPTSGMEVGDVWNIETGEKADMNYAWTGEFWDPLGMTLTIEPIPDATIEAILEEVTSDAVSR